MKYYHNKQYILISRVRNNERVLYGTSTHSTPCHESDLLEFSKHCVHGELGRLEHGTLVATTRLKNTGNSDAQKVQTRNELNKCCFTLQFCTVRLHWTKKNLG